MAYRFKQCTASCSTGQKHRLAVVSLVVSLRLAKCLNVSVQQHDIHSTLEAFKDAPLCFWRLSLSPVRKCLVHGSMMQGAAVLVFELDKTNSQC
mmetsp:Transcript_25649/g.41094  ORF Transcript_25649/g.41094 Transcript_25649/m.41094 type:complete len:94 (+) Transcript_25649:1185-1466(+)